MFVQAYRPETFVNDFICLSSSFHSDLKIMIKNKLIKYNCLEYNTPVKVLYQKTGKSEKNKK